MESVLTSVFVFLYDVLHYTYSSSQFIQGSGVLLPLHFCNSKSSVPIF